MIKPLRLRTARGGAGRMDSSSAHKAAPRRPMRGENSSRRPLGARLPLVCARCTICRQPLSLTAFSPASPSLLLIFASVIVFEPSASLAATQSETYEKAAEVLERTIDHLATLSLALYAAAGFLVKDDFSKDSLRSWPSLFVVIFLIVNSLSLLLGYYARLHIVEDLGGGDADAAFHYDTIGYYYYQALCVLGAGVLVAALALMKLFGGGSAKPQKTDPLKAREQGGVGQADQTDRTAAGAGAAAPPAT